MTHQPEPVANPFRSALHNEGLPDGDLTPRQRSVADAVRHCDSLSDFTAVPEQIATTVVICMIPYGMPSDLVSSRVAEGISKARAELDRLEGVLRTYGPTAFSPRPYPVPTRHLGADTRKGVVINLLRFLRNRGHRLVQAGDRTVSRHEDGSYVVEG
jgi:hypothetical protein